MVLERYTNKIVKPVLVSIILGLSIFASFNLLTPAYANPCNANPCPTAFSPLVNEGAKPPIFFRDVNTPDSSAATISLDKDHYLVGETATVTIHDFNENVDITSIDSVTVTVQPTGEIVVLTETGVSTGTFVGSFTVPPAFSGISYTSVPAASTPAGPVSPTGSPTGRVALTLNGVTGTGTVGFKDFIIPSGFESDPCFVPILNAVRINLNGITPDPTNGIGVTISYANGLFNPENVFPSALQMYYLPDSLALDNLWQLVTDTEDKFAGYHNFDSQTVTNDVVDFPPITESGLVVLGWNGGCQGGGSVGLVSAGFVLNFLAGAGASEHSVTPPSFGGSYYHYSDGLTITQGTQKTIFDTSKYNQEIPTQVMTSGQKVNMKFKTFEGYNPNAVVHMGLYIIPRSQDMVTTNSIGSIIYDKNSPVEINDPNHILSSALASTNVDGKFQYFDFSFVPTKSYNEMSFLARAWNDHMQSTDIRVHDAVPVIEQPEVYPTGVYKFTDWSALYVKLTNDGFDKPKITNHIQGIQSMNGGDSGLQVYWLYDTNTNKLTMIIKDKDDNKAFEQTETLEKMNYSHAMYCDLKQFQNACTINMLYIDSPDFHTWYNQHMTPDTIKHLKQMGFWES